MNIIVGGTSGLGKEIARELRGQGLSTFVLGRTYDKDKDGQGMAIDLLKDADVQKAREYIGNLGKNAISGFFWVAGYGYNGDFVAQEKPEDMAKTNFGNVLPIAQTAWEQMLNADSPTNFVVVSSTTGFKARKDEATYAGTKHAQVGFTRSLGLESERLQSGVRVALCMPGGMQTPFWKEEPSGYETFLDPEKVAIRICEDVLAQQVPFEEHIYDRGSL